MTIPPPTPLISASLSWSLGGGSHEWNRCINNGTDSAVLGNNADAINALLSAFHHQQLACPLSLITQLLQFSVYCKNKR